MGPVRRIRQRWRSPVARQLGDLSEIFLFDVSQSLLFDAGRNTRLHQGRLEILRQEVFRTQFDGVDDTAHFFIEGGDDDHRQIAGRARRLERLEHLEPVHFGHDYVEEDEIEPASRDRLKRRFAALDPDGFVPQHFDRLFQLQPNRV